MLLEFRMIVCRFEVKIDAFERCVLIAFFYEGMFVVEVVSYCLIIVYEFVVEY